MSEVALECRVTYSVQISAPCSCDTVSRAMIQSRVPRYSIVCHDTVSRALLQYRDPPIVLLTRETPI